MTGIINEFSSSWKQHFVSIKKDTISYFPNFSTASNILMSTLLLVLEIYKKFGECLKQHVPAFYSQIREDLIPIPTLTGAVKSCHEV